MITVISGGSGNDVSPGRKHVEDADTEGHTNEYIQLSSQGYTQGKDEVIYKGLTIHVLHMDFRTYSIIHIWEIKTRNQLKVYINDHANIYTN